MDCDANLPAGLIRFMREQLRWDVFFVMEEEDLRRASDLEHFRMAAQLRRTLMTLDRDYLNDARFPPAEGSGVLVMSASDQEQFERLLKQVDRVLFRQAPRAHAAPRPQAARARGLERRGGAGVNLGRQRGLAFA